jgi:FixJ family two-component response regulator
MSERPLISIVDDDAAVCEAVVDLLDSFGFAATAFRRADDFLKSDRVSGTDCLIADVQMPGMTGLELHEHLIGAGVTVPTILITAFPKETDRARAMQSGIHCYLAKPFSARHLFDCIRAALDAHGSDSPGAARGDRHDHD